MLYYGNLPLSPTVCRRLKSVGSTHERTLESAQVPLQPEERFLLFIPYPRFSHRPSQDVRTALSYPHPPAYHLWTLVTTTRPKQFTTLLPLAPSTPPTPGPTATLLLPIIVPSTPTTTLSLIRAFGLLQAPKVLSVPPSSFSLSPRLSVSPDISTRALSKDQNPSSSLNPHKTCAFVSHPGLTVRKRPRRRYDEIERLYRCAWPDCTKSYGTSSHLNAHVAMPKHGPRGCLLVSFALPLNPHFTPENPDHTFS